jgi:hypothetical protein
MSITNILVRSELLVAVFLCVLFLAAVEAHGPVRDLINRMLEREQITEIKDILDKPEGYASKTVTIEGTFGGRTTLAWMEGTLYGVYDEEGNGLTIDVPIDYERYAEIAKSDEEYYEMMEEFHERMSSLGGKKVRVTGVVGVYYMEIGWADAPVLIVNEDDIELIR